MEFRPGLCTGLSSVWDTSLCSRSGEKYTGLRNEEKENKVICQQNFSVSLLSIIKNLSIVELLLPNACLPVRGIL